MDDRFAPRLQEMLDSAVCHPEVTAGTLARLQEFLRPYAESLTEPAQRTHTHEYVQGLFSKLEHKTGEAIAYLHDQERQGLQKFIGQVPWDHQPLLTTLATQVGEQIGAPDGVIVFDPSAFAKKGQMSVGVARQWCGRLGKVDPGAPGSGRCVHGLCHASRAGVGRPASVSPEGVDGRSEALCYGRHSEGHALPHAA